MFIRIDSCFQLSWPKIFTGPESYFQLLLQSVSLGPESYFYLHFPEDNNLVLQSKQTLILNNKPMKHILAIIIFFPITTVFIISIFFEMLWRMLYAFHYSIYGDDMPAIPFPEPINSILATRPKLYIFVKFLLQILSPIELFIVRLKEINQYKF